MASTEGGGGGSSGGAAVAAAALAIDENRDGGSAPNELLFDAGTEFGGLVSKIDMSDAVRMACGERGIAAGVSFDGVTLQELGQDPRAADIKNALCQVGKIFPLRPFQILAVSRFVYMPRRRIEVRCETRDGQATEEIFMSPESDIGSFALLDLPTGTGKTITSLLGAVLFCAVRGGDMAEILLRQKECYMGSSTTSVVSQDALDAWPQAGAGRRCIVFVAGHLVQQWVDHADIVRKIIKGIPALERWDVSVCIGKGGKKGDHTHVLKENEVRVYVCSLTTQTTRPVSYLRKTTYYSTIGFDECGENSADVNGMLSGMPKGVRCGKLFSCSADLTPWKKLSPQNPSVFRQVFPAWDYHRRGSRDIKATTCASAIFTPDQRPGVMNECAQTLRGIFVATASVEYIPSLAERVGVGYGVELGNKSGHDLIKSKYGVDVSQCKTHHDMKVAIQAAITVLIKHIGVQGVSVWRKQDMEKKRDVLVNLLPRVACLPDETCCICLEPMESASLLQPCMHSICSSPCAEDLARMNMPCPTCRGEIGSKMNVDVIHTPVSVVDVEPRPIKKQRLDPVDPVDQYPRVATTAAEAALEEIRISCGPSPPSGVAEAVRRTLLSIKEARNRTGRGSDTLLVMVIIPDIDVKEGLFDNLGFDDVMYHRSKGCRGDKVYQAKIRAQLQEFEEKNERSKILFVRDGHTDCMTGLDIEGLDAVISVGSGNFAQRLGRLCRFSRARLSVEKRNALYVEIVPRE